MRRQANRLVMCCMVIVVFGVLFACYFSMSGFYRTHFLPNTYFDDTDVGGWSLEDLKSYYSSVSDNRKLILNGRDDISDSVLLSDIDFQVAISAEIEDIVKQQNVWLWFTSYFSEQRYECVFDVLYDEDKLQSQINNSLFIKRDDVIEPVDAKLAVGESGYEIVPEVEGNVLDVEQLLEHIHSELSENHTLFQSKEIVLDITDDYVKPKVCANDSDLQEQLASVKELGGFSITIDLVDAEEVLTAEQVNSFARLQEDGSFVYDEDLVAEYVNRLAKQYTTLHSTREFQTTRGDVISFRSDTDSYGFIFDKPETCSRIMEALKAGKDAKIEAAWWEGYGLPKQRNSKQGDIGDTYVEVSMDEQKMYFYKDGQLKLETDVVTGTDNDSRRTPTGVYFIWKRESPSKLSGSYGSQDVTYWMAFSWDGCGIHDATWRSQFGGDIWLSNGSHGCVNTPIDKCKELYDMIEYDTPVVVYRR